MQQSLELHEPDTRHGVPLQISCVGDISQQSLSVHPEDEHLIDSALLLSARSHNEPQSYDLHSTATSQHSLSVHVDEEQVIELGFDFKKPNEQLKSEPEEPEEQVGLHDEEYVLPAGDFPPAGQGLQS